MQPTADGNIRTRVQTQREAENLSMPWRIQFPPRGVFSTKRKKAFAHKHRNKQ